MQRSITMVSFVTCRMQLELVFGGYRCHDWLGSHVLDSQLVIDTGTWKTDVICPSVLESKDGTKLELGPRTGGDCLGKSPLQLSWGR